MKKVFKNKKGFTLTEVMIGMTILTIAIVSATSLLVGLIGSNQNNMKTLQANYLAIEGIEAVRNIRDTNWLHNRDWLGSGSTALWTEDFKVPNGPGSENLYSVNLERNAFLQAPMENLTDKIEGLNSARTWTIGGVEQSAVKLADGEDSGFDRVISFEHYDCGEADCSDYALVTAKVSWVDGAKNREVSISEVLTNWKGGAL